MSTQDTDARAAGDTLVNKSKRPWSFVIEKNFVIDTRLSRDARMLFIIIKSFASESSPVPFPGVSLLCRLLGCTEDTYRKYRQELEDQEWLRVERHRCDKMKFQRNQYNLLDGPPDLENPSPKKPGMEKSGAGKIRGTEKAATKSTHVQKSGSQKLEERNQGGRRAPGGASPAPLSLPSASVPEPLPAAKAKPESVRTKADEFVNTWKKWYERFFQQKQVVDMNQYRKLKAFFENEPDFTVREAIAIALNAWLDAEADPTGGKDFFLCVTQGKLPGNLLNNMTGLLDEIAWKHTERRINRVYEKMEKRIQDKLEDQAQAKAQAQ